MRIARQLENVHLTRSVDCKLCSDLTLVPDQQYNWHNVATEVKLDAIIEALEMADDSISSYLDVETGEVRSITEEEFDLAEDLQAVIEDLPDWQLEAVKLARSVREQEGKRYLALPDKFDVHEWAIMDRFSQTLKDAQTRNDFHGGIRGAGAFRLFKHLLTEYNLWDAWNRFKQVELRQMAIEWCEENDIAFRQA
jgi:Uncharacterised protein family (UPF0158)